MKEMEEKKLNEGPKPQCDLQTATRLARILVDIADDLLFEHYTEAVLGGENLWAHKAHEKVIEAHNTFNNIYFHDMSFADDEKALKDHFANLVSKWIKDNGKKLTDEKGGVR